MANQKKKSEKQAYFAQQRKNQRKAAAKAARKKKRIKKIVITSVSCVAAAAIVAGGITWAVKTNPLMHFISVEKTENNSVSVAEMSFYAWQIYQRYMEQYSEEADSAPDTEKPLSQQDYDDDMTWEEYFTDAAKDYANNLLILCEAAHRDDFTPEDDLAVVAKSMLVDLELDTLPKGVTEEDAQNALEKYLLAWEYSEHINDSMTFTEEELNAFYEADPKTMQICDYMYFSFAYGDDETAMDSKEAEEYARDLRRCTTREKFEQWVYDYYQENTTLTEEELQQQVSTLTMESAFYAEGNLVSEWAFSGESKAGETVMLDDTDNSCITVCLMLSEPKRNETHAVDIRQILFTANTYGSADEAYAMAESALEAYQSGDMTEDSFASLADQYTEDTSVTGGLYSDVTEGDLLPAWKDWYFDPDRQYGDVTTLYSSYGSAAAYYIGANEKTVWESTAETALQESRYDEKYEEMEDAADVSISKLALKLVKAD